MSNVLDLSVCMATWNGRDLTLACLNSLIEYTKGITYEIILVDNGSTDGTVQAVQASMPQVRIIANASNEGFAYANNQALRVATGRFAILVNNDMLFEMDALSRMVAFMDARPDVGVLGCRLRYPNRKIQPTAHEDYCWQDYLYSALFLHRLFPRSRVFGRMACTYVNYEADDLAFETGFVAGAALMVRSAHLKEVGLLDERVFTFAEDWEWCRRFANHGYKIVYYTGAEIIHYHGLSSFYYSGKDSDKVRERSILRWTAAAFYVFRKLHPYASSDVMLFDFAFRLRCLSRTLAFGLRCLLRPRIGDYGMFRGYLACIFVSYQFLRQKYLRHEKQRTGCLSEM